ncbi:MAG: tRNA (N6-isopentenyl adenosine(37)-C2)-methylthiotransferase MiaB [bacterium]|nr:tRNA (N6-isopentenyl adenosine(37)-C2)-methylthiotransferase MiaB [bacterium]
MKGKTFYLLTYGCQMNVYDSRLIAEILSKNGYKEIKDENKADIIIMNTCSVRKHAEQRVVGRTGDLQRLREDNPDLIIGLVGCMAQNLIDTKEKIKGVDFMVGPDNYRELPKIIKGNQTTATAGCHFVPNQKYKTGLELYEGVYANQDNKVSAFVPVMRGCENFCTYCIVPYVRVGLQMRPQKDILKEVEGLLKKGIKEIILLGQSVNEYDNNKVDFPGILKMVSETSVARLGFFTSHPYYTTQKLIDVIAEGENIYKWIHLPLQSGSNQILKKMNRKYTKEKYMELICNTREKIPNISITTDIIVGFPGETDEDFQETIEVMKEIHFDFAYMFKYSDRERTAAYNLKPKIPEPVKTKRLSELIDIQHKIIHIKNEQLIGTTQEVLVQYKGRKNNVWRGKTKQNEIVVVEGKTLPGEIVKVKISSLKGWTPYGVITDKRK